VTKMSQLLSSIGYECGIQIIVNTDDYVIFQWSGGGIIIHRLFGNYSRNFYVVMCRFVLW
jgi:hypothetical protein